MITDILLFLTFIAGWAAAVWAGYVFGRSKGWFLGRDETADIMQMQFDKHCDKCTLNKEKIE